MIKAPTKLTDRTRQSIYPLLLVAAFSFPTITIAQDNNADDVLFVSDSVTDAINIPFVLSGESDEVDHPTIPGAKYRPAADAANADPIYHNVTIIRNDYAVTGGSFGEAEGTNLALLGDLFPYCSVFWSASGPHEPLGLFPDRITNGDFENIGGTHGGGVIFVPAEDPSTVLTGWAVDTPVNWDFSTTTPPGNDASSGAGFVDLTPTGQISQMLNTEAGQMYMLSIDRKGDGSFVSLNGSYLVLTAGETSGNWTTFTAMFMAPTTMTSLVISGTSAGENAIDNIRFAPYPQTPGLGADGGLHIDPDVIANLDYYVLNGGFLFVTGHDAITHPPSVPAVSDGPLVQLLGGASALAGQTVDPSYTTELNDSALGINFPAGNPPVGGENQVDGVHEQDYLSDYDAATTPLVTGPGGAYWTVRSPYGDAVDDDGTEDGVDLTDGHIAYVANGVFFYQRVEDELDASGDPIVRETLSDGEDPTWLSPPYSTALLNFAANSCAAAPSAETPTADDQSVSTYVNTPVDITLTGFDPNSDPLTFAITSGPSDGSLGTLVDDMVTYTPDLDYIGNDSFTFTASDGTNTSPLATVSIEVLPIPPLTVDAGPDVFIDEGSGTPYASSGSFIDPIGGSWTATVDFGEGAGPVALPLTDQTFNLNNTYPTDDDDVFVVTVAVTDPGQSPDTFDDETATDSAVVVIVNVPPNVDAGPDDSINEGDTFLSTERNFTDPGPNDTHVATVDYGDGGGPVGLALAGKEFTLNHAYTTPGEYTVTVTVTDKDGGIGTDTVTVTVLENATPSVEANKAAVTVDEGQIAGNTGTFADANAEDTVSVTASIGSISQTGTQNGTWSWSYGTTDGPDNSQVVTITATDSEGAFSTTTFQLNVNNVAPSVAPDNNPVTVSEGTTATNSGTFSDPGVDVVTISASVGTISQSGTQSGTWSWSYGTVDGPDDSQVVTITATDDDGASSTTTFNLVVNNVAPSVAADNDPVTVNEGDTATNTGTFSDPGLDSVTISASVGTIIQSGTQSGTWSWSFGTQDGPDDSQIITITATDDDGAFSTTTFQLNVNNVAPSVAADTDPVTVNEGNTATNTGTFSDPGLDVVTISASVGTISQSGSQSGTWSWSYPTTDNADSQTVTVTATDSDGAFSTTTFDLTVLNVAPTVGADTDPVTVNESVTATNSGTFSDPGLDVVTISASVGSISQTGSQNGTWSWSYPTTDNADSQTVTITATDSDGALSTTTFDLNVLNVAPTVASDNDLVTVNEGETATNTGTFSDPGLDVVTITASVGAVSQTGSQSGTWSWSYGTSDGPDDSQTVTVTATDSDGAFSTTTFSLVVNNLTPALAADNATVTANEGGIAGNTGTFADAGTDTVSVTASVGTVSQSGTQSGTWSWAFAATDGPEDSQTVTMTATDSDGASSTTTFDLIVLNVPPVANDDAYGAIEDTPLAVPADGVLANDTDVGLDSLTASVTTGPSNGTLVLNGDGSFTYTPDLNWFGTDTFIYTATDDDGAADTAVVTIDVAPVNDPPTLSVDISTQMVQYSDGISPVTITAADIDDVLPPASLVVAGGPAGLSVSAGSCAADQTVPAGTGSSCTWTLSGNIGVGAGTYTTTLTVNDGEWTPLPSASTDVVVVQEDAMVAFDPDNPVAIIVDDDGSGSSMPFSLTAVVTETIPDLAANGLTAAGDIGFADVSMALIPVGPGSPVSSTGCNASTAGAGYAATQTVTCSFNGAPVNTYSVHVTVSGDYYAGSEIQAFTVYDPSLGFTTGGGWFYWPGTDDKTNFSYTVSFGKDGRSVMGNVLLVRHLSDGTLYRLKSDDLEGLAVGETGAFSWAAFRGTATYLEPGMRNAVGELTFTAYVEDRGEPGAGIDRFSIETRDNSGNVLPSLTIGTDVAGDAVSIDGGNIAVPHTNKGGKK
jgi:hypothetical protein